MVLPLTALVLAGGRSSRLGRDKALVPVNGTPMIARVVAAVARAATEVLILGGDEARLRSLGHRVIADELPGEGPLPALRTGLQAMGTEWAFATSCDAPLLQPELVEFLWRWRGGHEIVLPFSASDRLARPLCALYAKACVPEITATLGRGERQMTALLRRCRYVLVPEDSVRLVDPFLRSFHNVNTEEDLRIAEEIAAQEDR